MGALGVDTALEGVHYGDQSPGPLAEQWDRLRRHHNNPSGR